MNRLVITICLIFPCLAIASAPSRTWTVSEALTRLRDGNARYVNDKPIRWNSGDKRRQEVSLGQTPYACIITCSDSRVPPEQIFDAGLGDLFVVRVAGNVTPPEVIASADYAVGHLHCPVVIVMGHTSCGAVGAALAESDFPEPLNSLLEEIRPSVRACEYKGYSGESLYEGVIKENAWNGASQLLSGSRAIEEAVAEGSCVVFSAVYDLETGEVLWQSQLGTASPVAKTDQASAPGIKKHDEPAPIVESQQATRKSISTSKSRH